MLIFPTREQHRFFLFVFLKLSSEFTAGECSSLSSFTQAAPSAKPNQRASSSENTSDTNHPLRRDTCEKEKPSDNSELILPAFFHGSCVKTACVNKIMFSKKQRSKTSTRFTGIPTQFTALYKKNETNSHPLLESNNH